MKWKNLLVNLSVGGLSLFLVFGGLELGFRTFGAKRIKTYFDEQTERELGSPVPRKNPQEYRIFIFGGSAAYGFPVADRYSIAAWLRKSFKYLLPNKKIYVMNTAWPGKGSHHVLEGGRTVLKYEPDLFIIYSGHNETPTSNRLYVDNWLYWLNLRLYFRSAFYRYLTIRLDRFRKKLVYGHSGYAEKHYREEIIANKVYKKAEVSDADYERILSRYRKNIEEVIRIAKRRHIDILMTTLPSNLQEIPPQQSLHVPGLNQSQLEAWSQLLERGIDFSRKGQYPEALQAYREALNIDSEYAEVWHKLGSAYEQIGRYEEAKAAYERSRDLDRLPWRAKSRLNELVRELSYKRRLMLVDLVKIFERISVHGITGSELIYDNVHPTVEAEQVISDEICHTLASRDKIAPAREWNWKGLEEAQENQAREEWKVEGSLNAYRYILRGLYLWEGKRFEQAVQDLQKGLKLMPAFTESYVFLGDSYWHLGQEEKAGEMFRQVANQEPGLFKLLLEKYPDLQKSYAESTGKLGNH